MVTTRKGQNRQAGGRSGVVINKIDDSNVGLDGWFDSARSPEADPKNNAAASSKEERRVDDDGSSGMKGSRKKTVKTPKQRLDMTLRGAAQDDDTEEEIDSTSAKKYASKLRRKGGAEFTSPSELSKVSTAAFTPRDEDDSETENGLMTQENNEENDYIARQSAHSEHLDVASPEVDFPADEDDGDDLGPPVLPQEFSNDEEPTPGKPSGTEGDDEKIDSGSAGNNDIFDDHDDGDEGPGFNMVHDPETPLTVREDRAKKEMEKIREERKKLKKKNGFESDDNNDDDDDDDEESKSILVKKNKKQRKKKNRSVVFSPQGRPIANRDYETVPIGALVEGSPDEDGPRRSMRAKVQPLQYWRGEKMQFGAHNEHGYIGKAFGDMPVVTGIQKALPTPYKKRKQPKNKPGTNKGSRKHDSSDIRGSAAEEEFNSKKLRRKYKFHDGEEAYLWDDITDDTADQSKLLRPASSAVFGFSICCCFYSVLLIELFPSILFFFAFAFSEVVAYAQSMEGSNLPISKKRKKTESRITGKAAQAFNISSDDNDDYVGYIMGNLLLPPKGIKDSESVGPCSQTFTVCHSQPKAVEVAFGDPDQPDGELDTETAQRFLLGPGDMFRVPPGNSYRLENHSDVSECLLTWTIIRPRSAPTAPS
jgi:centromere protein C